MQPEQKPSVNAAVADALRRLWAGAEEHTNRLVGTLERGTHALVEGSLDEATREEAQRAAHRVAGTAGTFGYHRASVVAKQIEALFESQTGTPEVAASAVALLAALRAALPSAGRPWAPSPDLDSPAPEPSPRVGAPPAAGDPIVLVVGATPSVDHHLKVGAEAHGFTLEPLEPGAVGDRLLERPASAALVQLARGGAAEDAAAVRHLTGAGIPAVVLLPDGADPVVKRAAVRAGARVILKAPYSSASGWRQVADALASLIASTSTAARIVAVDDDETVLQAIHALLNETIGAQVTTVNDPDRFWAELNRVEPDLLLLDIEMPGSDGLFLCQAIRSDPRWRHLPIVVLSARTDPQTVQRVYSAGADDFVTKPIVGPELHARIANRLERTRLHRTLAETDALTGLANRRRLDVDFRRLKKFAERYRTKLCVAVIDVDRFKRVNDRYGHAVGDGALRAFGMHLQDSFRGEDVVARLGGEEFVIAMLGIERSDAVQRLSSVLETFRARTLTIDGHRLRVGASAGVAQYGPDGTDFDVLYRGADDALRRAKARGRGMVLSAGEREPAGMEEVDVAIVEGDQVVAELLRHALTTADYGCAVLPDAAQAARRLAGHEQTMRAGAILVDVDRSSDDAGEALQALRKAGATSNSAVVVFSADDDAARRSARAGGADIVPTPFTVPALVDRLQHALQGDR